MRYLLLLLILTGCGYRWQPEFPEGKRPLISVSYVEGDGDGTLTGEVVRRITSSGCAEVCHRGGDLRLQISIQNLQTQTVGYRRDRQKVTGEIRENIVAIEGRKSLSAIAHLYLGQTNEIAYGPYQVTADADYDYVDGDSLPDLVFINASGMPTTVLQFSLGQLEPPEAAQEASSRPLHVKLAQKIVDAIFSEW